MTKEFTILSDSNEIELLNIELAKELSKHHVLYGKEISAFARRNDNVLYQLDNGKYALVHLTWNSQEETNSLFPHTQILENWENI